VESVYGAMLLVCIAVGVACAEGPQVLKAGSWLCSSPEAYDQAVAAERERQGKDLAVLKEQFLEQKLCMYVENMYVEDMMAPFVTVLEQQGKEVHVSFTVQPTKRIEVLYRLIRRITYAGWTKVANLQPRESGATPRQRALALAEPAAEPQGHRHTGW
jgi:hypothetical protein